MIRLFGEISLYLALFFAFTQSVLPLYGYAKKNIYLLAFSRPSAIAQFIFVCIAYTLMTVAFATNDFSIQYVAANSHSALPLMYKLTAVWGAHEGSILFWILILNVWTLIFNFSNTKDVDNKTLALAILGLISFCFLSFLLFTSNPFLAATQISQGKDLSPLLQDPGLVIHPPMLYIGYVGFSVAFAITLAALIRGKLDDSWAVITRRFALAAWCFLTLGITLGSWWAYRVLGWGGFWFWDPVENASLLPWLSGTALIHVLILCEKRNAGKSWAALLAIISFALSLLGTFLVRSGVLISVHTFANDPTRGVFLLLLLAVLITAALIVYVNRISVVSLNSSLNKNINSDNLSLNKNINTNNSSLNKNLNTDTNFYLLSRETALLINSALLIVAMTTILLGTLYPLIIDALQLGTISVGPPYFNKVMMPLIFILMICMGLGVLLNWQQQSLSSLWKHVWKKILLSVICAYVLLWGVMGYIDLIAMISLSLSFWIILSVQKSLRFYPGMSLAHIGFAILVIGIMLSSSLNQESEIKIQPGDNATLGPYQFYFLNTKGISGSNYRGIQANFEVKKSQRHITNMYPEKRIYTVREMVMTKVDIHPSLFRDLYIALGQPLENDYWSVRIYYKPFVRWIWFGGLIMMLGGMLAIIKRRDA